MPEISQYAWSHKELLELLIKQAGVHEGKWMLVMEFAMAPGNFGPSPDEVNPGMVVSVGRVAMHRAKGDAPSALVLDASEINPKQPPRKKSPSKD